MLELTEKQQEAYDKIVDWFACGQHLITMGGYAGTGKTTLVGMLAREFKTQNKRIAFCTVAGKASTVLRSKLDDVLTDVDYCGTIHGLIYMLIDKEKTRSGRMELIFEKDTKRKMPYDLIVIDEASMVSESMFRDLSSYGIPILAVGDHGQLPPVKSQFNLMENPQIRLETIMRQEENSPIIIMCSLARTRGAVPYGDYGQGCLKTQDTKVLHSHPFSSPDAIMICALNKTRVRYNNFAREKLGIISPYPVVGEPVICLYNNRRKMIFNGNIGILKSIEVVFRNEIDENKIELLDVEIDMGDFIYRGTIDPSQFGKEYVSVDEKDDDLDYFDWAYCITCHKAQGSEFKQVLVIEEGEFMFKNDLWNKWLYTALSRAKERLIIYKR